MFLLLASMFAGTSTMEARRRRLDCSLLERFIKWTMTRVAHRRYTWYIRSVACAAWRVSSLASTLTLRTWSGAASDDASRATLAASIQLLMIDSFLSHPSPSSHRMTTPLFVVEHSSGLGKQVGNLAKPKVLLELITIHPQCMLHGLPRVCSPQSHRSRSPAGGV